MLLTHLSIIHEINHWKFCNIHAHYIYAAVWVEKSAGDNRNYNIHLPKLRYLHWIIDVRDVTSLTIKINVQGHKIASFNEDT